MFSLFVLFTPFHSKSYARLRKNFPQLLLGAVDAHLHEIFGDARLGGDLADGHLADLEERVGLAQDGWQLRERRRQLAAPFGAPRRDLGRQFGGADAARILFANLLDKGQSAAVAGKVDGSLIVAQYGHTRTDMIKYAIDVFDSLDSEVIGIVTTNSPRRSGAFGSVSRYYRTRNSRSGDSIITTLLDNFFGVVNMVRSKLPGKKKQ